MSDRKKPSLVIMAAGLGSRYGGSKQIDPVGPKGEIIMDYSIYDAIRTGFGRIVFVINKQLEEDFRKRIISRYERHIDTDYVIQDLDRLPEGISLPAGRVKPWGTGHAVLSCRGAVNTPFAVINADDFYGRSCFNALYNHLSEAEDKAGQYDYCMVGFILKNTLSDHGHVARGLCSVDEDNNLVDIRELTRIRAFGQEVKYQEGEKWTSLDKNSYVSMNAWGFTLSIFNELEDRFIRFLKDLKDDFLGKEFFLPSVVGELLAEQKAGVKLLPTSDRWYGMTYREDKDMVTAHIGDMIEQGVYPKDLWGEIK